MPAQFIRDELAAISPIARQGQNRRWSVDAVVAEAERDEAEPGALRHVEHPRRPIFLTTARPSAVAQRAVETAVRCREHGTGKRIRNTANVLVSRVMSYPVACADLGDLDTLDLDIRRDLGSAGAVRPEVKQLTQWVRACATWSRTDLGDLGAMVLHLDEAHPHIHHLVPIRERADRPGTADLSFWRPGAADQRVREAARANGERVLGRDVMRATREARVAIADDYHAAVGSRFGHSRKSEAPRDRRKRRDHLELRDLRARAERAEAEVGRLSAALAAAEATIARLRAAIERARRWIAALRGDRSAARELSETPTLTEARLDAALIDRDAALRDLLRRRVVVQ